VNAPYRQPVAIALEFDGNNAPRVTAKGRGEVAAKILETAREHDVPVEENMILAEALSAVELDDQIPEPLYQAVAQVIAFVLSLRDTAQDRAHQDLVRQAPAPQETTG
jgi:flagellar biosynthesis protein